MKRKEKKIKTQIEQTKIICKEIINEDDSTSASQTQHVFS